MRTTFLTLTLLAAILLSAGCTGQRSIARVRADADQHAYYARYEQARADYQEVVDRAPSDWTYRVRLAESLVAIGDHAGAAAQYAIVSGVRPYDDAIAERYARAMFDADQHDRLISYLQRRAEDTRTVGDYLRLGWYAVDTGDADLALRALLTAVRLDAGRTVAPQLALADFYFAAGDRENGMRRLRMAHYIDPADETIRQRIRALGEVPGPSFALAPDSQ